jgi:tetratricopeptide (TPR) repeat protein
MTRGARAVVVLLALIALGLGFYQVPGLQRALEWRLDKWEGVLRGWIYPVERLPTPRSTMARVESSTPVIAAPEVTATDRISPTDAPTPTPLPKAVVLSAPAWEKQDWNNCGPATLSLALKIFGWTGDQYDVSAVLKPNRRDKNVNVEELVYHVRNYAGWLRGTFRVGGTLDLLKRLLAHGYPVLVEKGYMVEESSGGGWAGHYLLLTGFDESRGVFLAQDTNTGPDQEVTYTTLEEGWRAFNNVFILLYLPQQEAEIASILGPDMDEEANRRRALQVAREGTVVDPEDPFAWFNLGTNLVYFERYEEAAGAYGRALRLGLPWRFTRYQFGPYISYFHAGRFQDLIELATTTLRRTPEAEESLLWRGWARYRLGDLRGAREDFQAALEVNPHYLDAQYGLEYLADDP